MEKEETGESDVCLGEEIALPTELKEPDHSEMDLYDEKSYGQTIGKILEIAHKRQFLLQNIQHAQQKLTIFITKSSEKEFFENLNKFEDADEGKFKFLLDTIVDKTNQLKNVSEQCSHEIISLKNEIEEKEQSLAELEASFKESVKKTALNSVHSETTEKFTPKEVEELLMKEDKVLKSLREFHFYSIQKRYSLDKAVKEKNNLSEGSLDFAEYEMMCIGIQNNKEIIQPISEEIKNIAKKASNIINVLSHLEQKLNLAQKEKVKALNKEKILENELNQMRDELFTERMKYNKMKYESKELQHKFILLQHPCLIEDYNKVKQENEDAVVELEKLKNIYEQEMNTMKG